MSHATALLAPLCVHPGSALQQPQLIPQQQQQQYYLQPAPELQFRSLQPCDYAALKVRRRRRRRTSTHTHPARACRFT